MATSTLKASIPEMQLNPNMMLVWEAIDATTGAAVTGVKVSSIGIYGPNLGGAPAGESGFGEFRLIAGPSA